MRPPRADEGPRAGADEARRLGFDGVPDPPDGKDLRLIVVAQRYVPWIHRSLDASDAVLSFRVHPVD